MPAPNFIAQFMGQVVGKANTTLAYMQDWVGRLSSEALGKWGPVLASGIRCSVPVPYGRGFRACAHPAVGACEICGTPTCLVEHAMVASNADIVCTKCVNEFFEQKQAGRRIETERREPARSREEKQAEAAADREAADRVKHLATLGLKDPATWDEIKSAFRGLSIELHPDRKPAGQKAAAAERFKKITAAYHWLEKRQNRAAAA